MRRLRMFITLAPILAALVWLYCDTAPAVAQVPAVAVENAKCGVAFDKSSGEGIPPAMLAVIEAAHEVVAGQDCVATAKVPTACEHWQRALKALANADPTLAADISAGIKGLMQQHQCA